MFPSDMLRGQLAELRKVMVESQQQIATAHQKVKALAVTKDSPDGSVSITVDGGGVVRDLVFHDDTFRDLDPDELSRLLLDLLTAGQSAAREQVLALLPPSPVSGLSAAQLLDPETDAASLLPKDLFAELLNPSTPADRSES